jgi:hypothetical protein
VWRYLHEYEGYDEETARAIAAEMEASGGETIDFEDNEPGV